MCRLEIFMRYLIADQKKIIELKQRNKTGSADAPSLVLSMISLTGIYKM